MDLVAHPGIVSTSSCCTLPQHLVHQQWIGTVHTLGMHSVPHVVWTAEMDGWCCDSRDLMCDVWSRVTPSVMLTHTCMLTHTHQHMRTHICTHARTLHTHETINHIKPLTFPSHQHTKHIHTHCMYLFLLHACTHTHRYTHLHTYVCIHTNTHAETHASWYIRCTSNSRDVRHATNMFFWCSLSSFRNAKTKGG